MNQLPNIPYLKKGAIIQGLSVIPFQFTPTSLTRTLNLNAFSTQGREMTRLKGPPVETLSIDVLLDATDQDERGHGLTQGLGIYPSLAALELLLYPNAAVVLSNAILTAFGVLEIIPAQQPLTLLVWGPMRILPIQVTSLTITEEQYDGSLTPLRASVKVGVRVLTYGDLGLLSAGGVISYAGHLEKTALVAMANYPKAKHLLGID